MKTALAAVLSLAVAAAAHPAAGNVVNGLGSPLACKGGKFGELLCRSPREYTRCKGSENYQYVWSEVASGTVCTCTRTKCALVPKTSGYVGEDTRPATSLTYTMVGPRHTHRRHTKWHSKASSGTETNIITFSPTRAALSTTTTPTITLESGTSTVTGTSNIVRYTEFRTTTVVMTTGSKENTHSKHAHMTETDAPAGPYSNTSMPVVTKHATQTQTQTLTAQPDEMPQQIKAARPQTSRTEVFYMPFNPLPLPFYLEDHKSHPRAMEQQQQEQQQQEQHQQK